jgi:dTDP-4-amino-4,6-dideoxygalactose transaminase
VLEDCALAPGAFLDQTHMGLHGDVGVFSFYPVKHITTAEGGMIITKHAELARKLKLLKAFGVDRSHGERKEPGMYDTISLGLNYRMSELHAAIGIEQLKKLPLFLKKRKENFLLLENLLSDIQEIQVLPQPSGGRFTSCYYCMAVLLSEKLVKSRKDIMNELTAVGVGSSIYYPKPVPRMSYYKEKYGYDEKKFTNAAKISDGVIALPVGPHLNEEDIEYIAKCFKQIISKVKNES